VGLVLGLSLTLGLTYPANQKVLPQPKFQIVSHKCVLVHVALGTPLVLFNCYLWRTFAPTLTQTEAQVMVSDVVHLLLVQRDWEIKQSHIDLQRAPEQSAHQSARRHQHPALLWQKDMAISPATNHHFHVFSVWSYKMFSTIYLIRDSLISNSLWFWGIMWAPFIQDVTLKLWKIVGVNTYYLVV
jgi:hypothetical protein